MSTVSKGRSTEAILSRTWQQRGPLACLLWPLSLLFGALAALRRLLFALGIKRAERLPVPVVVVGNVFVGGTGKTPFSLWLIEALRAAGYTPGVVSRGYGGSGSGDDVREVHADSRAAEVGDEPLLMAVRSGVPLVVGRRRAAAGRALLAAHPEVDLVISDDGLQHYALARDIEIVLSDARGNGNGWLLPAGPLREPASRRRDFSVVNLAPGSSAPAGHYAMHLQPGLAWALADPARQRALDSMGEGGARIAAVAGIGNPGRFFATLRSAGLTFASHPLPDHHDFADNPFAALQADVILVTEKDAVKCRAIEAIQNDPRIWVVPVSARIDGALAEHIVEKLRERPTA